jgi:Domain of unknown function (DUF5916)/Carbohydrate family 9 binding domain-like
MPDRPLAVSLLVVWAAACPAAGSTLQLPHTGDRITIDGRLDEAAWSSAVRVDIDTETRPGENIRVPVRTVAYLIEDGVSLYLAFDAEDPDPGAIRAYLQDRDSAWNDDYVGVVLDTYNDGRRAFEFFSNPLGVQMDLTNDDVSKKEDDLWDAIWDAAGTISDEGYIVEMEIPLSQLRFPDTGGTQTWGIDLLRLYPRDQSHRLSNNPQDRARNCYLCQLDKIEGLEQVRPGRDLEITPTLTGSKSDATDSPGVVPLSSGGSDVEAGVSLSWGITPDTTANIAINPDFSQVEADVAQLEVNNKFALLYPEKRPFFLEGADYFTTPIDAVFTRTVVDPDVGVKLTGKRGRHTYGTFAARDAVTNLLLPGPFGSESTSLQQDNDVFVGHYSLNFGEASSVGALLTSRRGDAYHNNVGGFDLRWKINDQNRVLAQYLNSDTRYPDELATAYGQPVGSFSGNGLYLDYEYDSRTWFGYVKFRGLDSGFRSDTGFEPQVDFERRILDLGYNWWGTEDDWWTTMQLNLNWDITHDDSGRLIERESEAYFTLGAWLQSKIKFGGVVRDTLWDGVMYRENQIIVDAELQPRGGLYVRLYASRGDEVDFQNSRIADELRIEPTVEWYVNRHLFAEFRGAILRLDTKQGDEIFQAGIYDLRLTWQFNRNSSLRLIAQLQDVRRNLDEFADAVDAWERNLGRQLLYSYKLNPQTVFFAGYSDKLFDDDSLQRLQTSERTLFIKLGYAWAP